MSVWEILPVHPALIIFFLIIALISVWCFLYVYIYMTCGVCKSRARLDGKTVIITGCTSGLGKATAFDLARRGGRIIMACRNLKAANAVREQMVEETKNQNVVVRHLDVSLLSSVRQFAAEINHTEERLDILIHNAGISISRKVTEEGIWDVWATNHFGPFLLTHLLIDLLKKTGKSRIIYVASITHYVGRVDLNNVNPQRKESELAFYFNSKFAIVLITNELARRLEGSGVTANSVDPGGIYTNICNDAPLWWTFFTKISKPMLKTVEQGAQSTIYAAVSDEVEGLSGKYFADCKETKPSRKSRDAELARMYWELSEGIVQLKPTDPHI